MEDADDGEMMMCKVSEMSLGMTEEIGFFLCVGLEMAVWYDERSMGEDDDSIN